MKNRTALLILGSTLALVVFALRARDDPRASSPGRPPGAAASTPAGTASVPSERTEREVRPVALRNEVGGEAAVVTAPAEPDVAAEWDSILVRLRDPNLAASDESKLWRRLAELGMADDVIAALKAELEQAPMDTHLHTMLGNAYVTKLRSENLGPLERRAVSSAAMASFDTALEIDPQNWTARFSRAMSNSSAPAFLGLQKSAIEDFETLLAQQKQAPLSQDHAHTYFFLGNLHEGSGDADRAGEVRAEARKLFPEDPRFRR